MPDRQDVHVPDRIAQLPTWGGMPIPFSAWRDADGKPDFRVVDGEKNSKIATLKLCSICGVPIGRWAAFIGGPISMGNRTFFDGPMHRECAIYSSQVCPYLAMVRSYSTRPTPEESQSMMSTLVMDTPPDRMAYGITHHWTTAHAHDGTLVYIADPWVEVVWFRNPPEQ